MAEMKSNAKKVKGGLKARGKKLHDGMPLGMPKDHDMCEGSEAMMKTKKMKHKLEK